MDVMMSMSTADVRRLRGQFTHALRLGEFVALLQTSLRDRIHDELDFVVGVIELFHTIDVNGDGELDWDEFAAHMMDAGLARADFAGDDALPPIAVDSKQPFGGGKLTALGAKEYTSLELPPRDPKTPLNHLRSNIQQMIWVHDMNAVAYFEAGSDVVYLYALHFDRNDGPRHLSTMRLHTAFQEHVVIGIEYVPNGRRLLITSSVLARGIISVWCIADTRNPVVVRRFEASGALEMPVWVPSLQCIATSHVLLPRIAPDRKENRNDSHQLRRVFGDYYRPNAGANQQFTRANQILLLDLADKKPWRHKMSESSASNSKSTATINVGCGNEEPVVIRDGMRGVTSLAVFKWANRPLLAIGREDGIISVIDVEEARDIHEFDAHGSGVKVLAYSELTDYLASAGFHSFADETTLDVVIWKRHATTLLSKGFSKASPRFGANCSSSLSMKMEEEARLKGHVAPVELLTFVDSKRQLVTVDRSEIFLVFSSVMRTPTSEPWECLQRFSALEAVHFAPRAPQTLWSMFAVPETRHSDAVLIAAGSKLSFYDYCQVKDRDEELLVFFTYYCNALNAIVGATSAKLLLWRADSGALWRSYSYASIAGVDGMTKRHINRQDYESDRIGVITAVCVDDRERKIIMGDDSGTIRVINAVNGNVMKQLDPHSGRAAVIALAYVLHGKCVISLSAASELHICDEDQPSGYYVPFGGAPESVLLQSLRFVYKANTASSSSEIQTNSQEQQQKQQQRFSIVKAVANQVLNTIAVLVHGIERESFIQLWDFELTHALGTCVLPPSELPLEKSLDEEITALSLLASSGDIVAGTSRGRVLLWPDPGQTLSAPHSILEFPLDAEETSSNPANTTRGAIIYVSTLAIEETSSDSTGQKETGTDQSQSNKRALSLSTKEWASMFVQDHSIDDRISNEQRVGVFVVTGDDQGLVSVWIVRRSYYDEAAVNTTFMTHTDVPAQFSSLPSNSINVCPGMPKRTRRNAKPKRKASGSNNKMSNALQHGETVIGFDTIEALFHHAMKDTRNSSVTTKRPQSSSSSHEKQRVERLEAILCQSWRAHDEAIASLELSDDPRVVMTSSASGKIKVWSLDGLLLGIIDQRATRRTPTSHPWAFPVDMNERRQRQEREARQYLPSKLLVSPSHSSVAAPGRDWKASLRASVLQRRLSLSDGELRELTHPREMVLEEKKGHHRPLQLRQSDVGRAIRNFVLHQAAPSSEGQPGRKPTKLSSSSDASDDDIPLHTVLKEVEQFQLPEDRAGAVLTVDKHTVTNKKKTRWPMVTLADVKATAFRSRSSVHCDSAAKSKLGSRSAQQRYVASSLSVLDDIARPREILVTSSNQLEQPEREHHASRVRDEPKRRGDNVLAYHVKLAHSWNPPPAR